MGVNKVTLGWKPEKMVSTVCCCTQIEGPWHFAGSHIDAPESHYMRILHDLGNDDCYMMWNYLGRGTPDAEEPGAWRRARHIHPVTFLHLVTIIVNRDGGGTDDGDVGDQVREMWDGTCLSKPLSFSCQYNLICFEEGRESANQLMVDIWAKQSAPSTAV